jgi:hypothetical protein
MLPPTKEVPLNRWILSVVFTCAAVGIIGCAHHKKDEKDVNIKVQDDTRADPGTTSTIKVDKK